MEDAIFGLGLENSWLQLRQVNVDDIGDVEGLRLFSPLNAVGSLRFPAFGRDPLSFFH